MHWDDWIELDNEYLQYHSLKAARIAERGQKCCKTAPEAWDAAVELLEELCEYLPERYPSLYQRLEGWRNGVVNLATGETIDIKTRLEIDKEDPMQVCARLVQDDLAIMIEVCGFISAYHLLPKVLGANPPGSVQTANTTSLRAPSSSQASGVLKTNSACRSLRSTPQVMFRSTKRSWRKECLICSEGSNQRNQC